MKKILKSPKFIAPTLIIAFLYLTFTLYLLNLQLVSETLTGAFSLSYKFSLLFSLLGGLWTSMPTLTAIGLIISAVLTGANLVLVVRNLANLKSQKGFHFVVGGGAILGIVGSGCAACGLPLLSILGISGGLAILPFNGGELIYISILLLGISLYFLIKGVAQAQMCKIDFSKEKL